MSTLNSFKIGMQMAESANERRRQAERDAWLREEQDQKRQGWQREADAQARIDAARRAALDELDAPPEMAGASQLTQRFGLSPQYAQPDPTTAPPPLGIQRTPGTPVVPATVTQPTGVQPQVPRFNYSTPEGAAVRRQWQMARTPEEILRAESALANLRSQQEQAQLFTSVLNASPAQIEQFSKGFSDFKGVTGKLVPDTKTGMVTLELGEKSFPLNRTQLATYVHSLYKLEKGDPTGLQDLASIDQSIASAAEKDFARLKDVGAMQNDVAYKGRMLDNDTRRTNASIAASGRSSQNVREFVDAKGNTVLLDIASLSKNKDGSLAVPAGLRPKGARAEITTANVIDYAKSLVENNTPDPDAPNKPLTLDKAMVIARAQLGDGGYKTAADRLVEAYIANRGTPAATQPTAPAQGVKVPPRQITTIVPPRSAADLAPRQPATEEDIIKMLAR